MIKFKCEGNCEECEFFKNEDCELGFENVFPI